jgi:hypothetical protein
VGKHPSTKSRYIFQANSLKQDEPKIHPNFIFSKKITCLQHPNYRIKRVIYQHHILPDYDLPPVHDVATKSIPCPVPVLMYGRHGLAFAHMLTIVPDAYWAWFNFGLLVVVPTYCFKKL